MRGAAPCLFLLSVVGAITPSCGGATSEYGLDEAVGELVGAISVDTSKTYNIVGVGSDKCVQPKGGNTGAGTEAVISTCSGGVAQRFQFITQSGGYYSIKNVSSGLCLDVTDASTSNGALIKQWSCSSGTYQQFLVEDTGGGAVKLTARHSGLVIDVIGGGTGNGTGLHQWGWGGSTNQTFKLVASGTAGGGEDPCAISLSDKPDGFAAQAGGTTGGGNATPIQVTTASQLKQYLEDGQARVLHIMNDLDFRTAARTVSGCEKKASCDSQGKSIKEFRVSSTCNSDEVTATRTRNETTINVKSNKTVIGMGDGATLYGASFNLGNQENLIFRNLDIRDVNPGLIEAGDGFTITSSKHVWIDHCSISLISDGYLDVGTTASETSVHPDYITLSWSYINGRNPYQCGGQHSFVNFANNAKMTWHHNWYDNSSGRNPKLGGALMQAHLYNNYWLNTSYFCITAAENAQARVESNYFENASKPHWLQAPGAIAIDSGNVYTGKSTSTSRDVGGSVFSVPYSYSKDSGTAARDRIKACSGPRRIQ
ncbi:hypothetical protein F0U62_34575 [Cystobacter fuscus]|nr:hypothetical protein F0U62_34575 [Cystobacter fuscus]